MTWEALAGTKANASHVSELVEHNDSFVLKNLPNRRRSTMGKIRVELPCKDCSIVFSIFVTEAAKREGKITCPACGQTHEYGLADINLLYLTEQVVADSLR